MDSYRAQLTYRLAVAAARRPALTRLARFGARRWAGRHYVAAVAVVLDGDSVLLAKHRFRGNRWSLPGGWIRRREDPSHACARELIEELQLPVEVIGAVAAELHAVDGTAVRYGGLSIAFRCELLDGATRAVVDSVEISEAKWVSIDALDEYVSGFQIAAVDAAVAHRGRRRGA